MSKGVYSIIGQTLKKIQQPYIVLDGATKKIKKIYVTVNGLAKECFGKADAFGSFTGAYTITDVIVDGSPKKLYTITESGTLTLNSEAQYWMCGGGGGGGNNDFYLNERSISGGGGGGSYSKTGTLTAQTYTVTIGAGGTSQTNGNATKIVGTTTLTSAGGKFGKINYYGGVGGDGGSGGGSGDYYNGSGQYAGAIGKGNGISTLPFELEVLDYHCAGGSGGSLNFTGGKGGSNGGNGATTAAETDGSPQTGVTGGRKGGGTGGGRGATDGQAATFYGGGGGGAGNWSDIEDAADGNVGGAGYQGVVYILTE